MKIHASSAMENGLTASSRQRDAHAAHVPAHLVQSVKSTFTSIGMIITQMSSPTGR